MNETFGTLFYILMLVSVEMFNIPTTVHIITLLLLALIFFGSWILWIIFFATVLIVWWMPKLLIDNLNVFYPTVLFRKFYFKGHQIDPKDIFNETKKEIFITIDDAPYSYKSTRGIIEMLSRQHIKVTFFVISGKRSEELDEWLISAIRRGHQLANHGHTDSAHIKLSPAELEREIELCDSYITELYQKAYWIEDEDVAKSKIPKVKYYRPGCGLFNQKMIDIVEKKGMKMVLGSVYPHDPLFRWSWFNAWYLKEHIEQGDIIIIHDREWTIPLIENIGEWLKATGYESKTLSQL